MLKYVSVLYAGHVLEGEGIGFAGIPANDRWYANDRCARAFAIAHDLAQHMEAQGYDILWLKVPRPAAYPDLKTIVFEIAAHQRVISLQRNKAGPILLCRKNQRFHQMPRRPILTAQITDLALPDQIVKRAQSLFDRRDQVPAMDLV